MSISVGIPTMMLDRATHKPGDNKHGNMKAVLKEGLPDENGVRKCHDEDYRPEDTKNNFCLGAVQNVTADAICNYWEMLADDYRVKVNTKNGVKERKLREDADIGMALIVKPEMSAMQAMTPDRQIEFLEDSYEAMNKVFYKHGLLIDVGVVHLDEGYSTLWEVFSMQSFNPFTEFLKFIYLFSAALGLHSYVGFSVVVASRGYSLLGAWTLGHMDFSSCSSWVPEHRFSSCSAWALFLCSTWDLPGPGIEPMSPALADGFFTIEPPGKPSGHNSVDLLCDSIT